MTTATLPTSITANIVKQPDIDVIYLSGGMSRIPEFNYPAFDAWAAVYRAAGYTVFSPAEDADGNKVSRAGMTGFEKPADIGFDLRGAFATYARFITTEADAIVVIPGWETSPGARGEVALGQGFGLPVIDATTGEFITPTISVEVADEDDVEENASPRPERFVPATPTERGEVKVTSDTGGSKAMKEARLDLVPQGPLWELAVLYGRGQMKYPDAVSGAPNWKRGYPWSSSYSALIRHANLFWMGEDHDPEMAVKHVIAVAWHAFNLAWFMENRREFDDRPTSVNGERYDGALPMSEYLKDVIAKREAAEAEEREAAAA